MSDDKTAQTPIPERFVGPVFAGRGQETHGVPMTGTPDFVDEAEDGDGVLAEPEPAPLDPVPVVIVHQTPRELLKFRMVRAYTTLPATGQPAMIAGQDTTRTRLVVQNNTANSSVWLAHAPHLANAQYGYLLAPGKEFSTTAETALYGQSDAAAATDPCPLSVLIEHTVTER